MFAPCLAQGDGLDEQSTASPTHEHAFVRPRVAHDSDGLARRQDGKGLRKGAARGNMRERSSDAR